MSLPKDRRPLSVTAPGQGTPQCHHPEPGAIPQPQCHIAGGLGRSPGVGAFGDLKRPTTPLPWRPPERRSTALVRELRQHTTGKRLWR